MEPEQHLEGSWAPGGPTGPAYPSLPGLPSLPSIPRGPLKPGSPGSPFWHEQVVGSLAWRSESTFSPGAPGGPILFHTHCRKGQL